MFHVRDLFPAFRGIKKGQSVFLAPAISQATLTPNNQYAKVVYVGLAYSAPLHLARPDNPIQKPSPHQPFVKTSFISRSHETISHQVEEKGKKLLAKLACECFPRQKDSWCSEMTVLSIHSSWHSCPLPCDLESPPIPVDGVCFTLDTRFSHELFGQGLFKNTTQVETWTLLNWDYSPSTTNVRTCLRLSAHTRSWNMRNRVEVSQFFRQRPS